MLSFVEKFIRFRRNFLCHSIRPVCHISHPEIEKPFSFFIVIRGYRRYSVDEKGANRKWTKAEIYFETAFLVSRTSSEWRPFDVFHFIVKRWVKNEKRIFRLNVYIHPWPFLCVNHLFVCRSHSLVHRSILCHSDNVSMTQINVRTHTTFNKTSISVVNEPVLSFIGYSSTRENSQWHKKFHAPHSFELHFIRSHYLCHLHELFDGFVCRNNRRTRFDRLCCGFNVIILAVVVTCYRHRVPFICWCHCFWSVGTFAVTFEKSCSLSLSFATGFYLQHCSVY